MRRVTWRLVLAALLAPAAARAQSAVPDSCSPPVAAPTRDEAQRRYAAGTASFLTNQWTEALAAFDEASRLDPRSVLAHFARGQTLTALRRYPEAVEAYLDAEGAFRCTVALSAAEKAESRKRLKRQIAALREEIRSFDSQRLVAQRAMAQGAPGTGAPLPSEGLSRVHEMETNLHELERWLNSDLDEPPAVLSLALGNAHFHSGALEEAEEAYRAALRAEPRSGDAHNNLAVVLMLTGRAEEAARELALAEKAGVPRNPRLQEEIRKRRLEAKPSPE
jgi:tetratricopeptide (TPR) repeat protein